LIEDLLIKHIIDFFARRKEVLEPEGISSASSWLGYQAFGYETAGDCLPAGTGVAFQIVFQNIMP
jgi:hypothetical protein